MFFFLPVWPPVVSGRPAVGRPQSVVGVAGRHAEDRREEQQQKPGKDEIQFPNRKKLSGKRGKIFNFTKSFIFSDRSSAKADILLRRQRKI